MAPFALFSDLLANDEREQLEREMLFDLLGLSCSWLTLPSAEWDGCPDCTQARAFVATVKTTNEVAERGGGSIR